MVTAQFLKQSDLSVDRPQPRSQGPLYVQNGGTENTQEHTAKYVPNVEYFATLPPSVTFSFRQPLQSVWFL